MKDLEARKRHIETELARAIEEERVRGFLPKGGSIDLLLARLLALQPEGSHEDQLLQPTLSHEDLRSIRCCSIRGSKVAIKRKADEGDFELESARPQEICVMRRTNTCSISSERLLGGPTKESYALWKGSKRSRSFTPEPFHAGDNMKPHSPRCQCERTRRAQAVHLHCLLPEGGPS